MNTQLKIKKSRAALSELLQVTKTRAGILLASLFVSVCAMGQTFNVLHRLDVTEGSAPNGKLVVSGGKLYGTAVGGGSHEDGTVFSLNTDGSGFAVLHEFSGTDGSTIFDGLTLSTTNGTVLYGMAYYGGNIQGWGTLFKINTDGSGFATLHTFGTGEGHHPNGTLVLNGTTLFGVTEDGGANGYGTVFKIQTDGTAFTTVYSFGSANRYPVGALLLSGTTFYGTTAGDYSSIPGTVFKLQTDGSGFTTLHTFDGNYGSDSGLVLSGTTLFGTTLYGGTYAYGNVFKVNTDGTGFTTLHSFSNVGPDGSVLVAPVVLVGDILYGLTFQDGGAGGTIFRMNTDGSGFTTLYNDYYVGYHPGWGGLISDGTHLYGVMNNDLDSQGTVFVSSNHLIDLDFDAGSGPSAKSGFAATGITANDFWNFYTRDDGNGGWRTSGNIPNLSYVDSSSSGVGLTINNAPGAWNNGSSDHMYGGYIYPFSGNATFTLTSLPAGNYNIYLYSVDGNYDLTVGGSYIGNVTTSDWPLHSDPPVWQNGVQYGKFSNVSVSSGQSVVVTVKPGAAGYAILSGMQIETVQP